MHAAVLAEPGRFELEERERPAPAADEVLVDVAQVGICGSDVHFFEHGRIGDKVVESPLVLGHESAGVAADVGADVTDHAVGDRVALEPGVPCRRCEYCRRGEYELCPDVTFMATPPDDGAFVESVAWPADYAFGLPESVSLQEGALAEPVAVGVHACRHADLRGGESVYVAGGGPIGLLAADVAGAMGATTTLAADPVAAKRERARERGVDRVVDPAAESVPETVERTVGGDGADVAIEASGAPEALADAVEAVKPGGTVVVLGLNDEAELPLDVIDLVSREITLQGSVRYNNAYPAAIGMLADGAVDAESLIDFESPLSEVQAAFERAQEPETVKGMIAVGE